MNDYNPPTPPEASSTPRPPITGSTGAGTSSQRWLSKRKVWIAGAAAVVCAAIGIPVGITASSSAATPPSAAAAPSAPASGLAGGATPGGGSNARSGPAEGGSTGTISSVSSSGFTLTTSAGQQVTVSETSATTLQNGTNPTSAVLTTGEPVLVLGTVNGTTITATQVTVHSSSSAAASSSAAQVVPFQRGAPSTAKSVGQIPANYTEGAGTIVGGTTADQATQAALAAYQGGVVDRVVQLSSGQFEVHYIGVNWPHHIFVNQAFQVVGAN
ncbi:MAG: hypothetical protein QOJ68_1302 [Blastococcus sp.]|nr:hypothetical protein [Blastococcus sp.]